MRFEDLQPNAAADIVTVRAVRTDSRLVGVSARLLRIGGHLVLFGKPSSLLHKAFKSERVEHGSPAELVATSYVRVFHVEQID